MVFHLTGDGIKNAIDSQVLDVKPVATFTSLQERSVPIVEEKENQFL